MPKQSRISGRRPCSAATPRTTTSQFPERLGPATSIPAARRATPSWAASSKAGTTIFLETHSTSSSSGSRRGRTSRRRTSTPAATTTRAYKTRGPSGTASGAATSRRNIASANGRTTWPRVARRAATTSPRTSRRRKSAKMIPTGATTAKPTRTANGSHLKTPVDVARTRATPRRPAPRRAPRVAMTCEPRRRPRSERFTLPAPGPLAGGFFTLAPPAPLVGICLK
mmetsp:Transcript_35556/g.110118  ORF Transcript_35556/g.110118 Transcript_35556/m.110118 type:complete len:226 (+) Transcript_35556:1087-1764(+)